MHEEQEQQQHCLHHHHKQQLKHKERLAVQKPLKPRDATYRGGESKGGCCTGPKGVSCCTLQVSGLHLGQQIGNYSGQVKQLQQAGAEEHHQCQQEQQRDQAARKNAGAASASSVPTSVNVRVGRRVPVASEARDQSGIAAGAGHARTAVTKKSGAPVVQQHAALVELHVAGKVLLPLQ